MRTTTTKRSQTMLHDLQFACFMTGGTTTQNSAVLSNLKPNASMAKSTEALTETAKARARLGPRNEKKKVTTPRKNSRHLSKMQLTKELAMNSNLWRTGQLELRLQAHLPHGLCATLHCTSGQVTKWLSISQSKIHFCPEVLTAVCGHHTAHTLPAFQQLAHCAGTGRKTEPHLISGPLLSVNPFSNMNPFYPFVNRFVQRTKFMNRFLIGS